MRDLVFKSDSKIHDSWQELNLLNRKIKQFGEPYGKKYQYEVSKIVSTIVFLNLFKPCYYLDMEKNIKSVLKKLFIIGLAVLGVAVVASTAFWNAEKIRAQQSPVGYVKVPILIYHSIRPFWKSDTDFIKKFVVPPSQFEKQLRYLKENKYTTVSLDDLVNYFLKNTPLPPKPVIITIDDGWENQYINAFPFLKKYGDKATFFIPANYPDNKNFLTWQEVKELDAAGMTIGAHTKSHPYLKNITNQNTLRDEIIGGKKIMENHLNHEVRFFAEPYGYSNDLIISIIKEAGYVAARTSVNGVYHTKDDLLNLKANDVDSNFDKFIKLLDPNNKIMKNSATSIFGFFPFVAAILNGNILVQDAAPTTDKQIIEQLQNQVKDLQDQNDNLKSELRHLKIQIRFSRTLKQGMSGDDVKQIQEFLRLFPEVYSDGLVTGYFGPATKDAIKRFQKIYGIETTGIVGHDTKIKLREQIIKEIEARENKSADITETNLKNPLIQSTASSMATSTPPEVTDIETYIENVDTTETTTPDIMMDTAPDLSESPESYFYNLEPPAETTLTPSKTVTVSSSSQSTGSTSTSTQTQTTTVTSKTTLVISNLQAQNISNDNATITWTTNIPANSEVQYSITSPVSVNNSLKVDNSDFKTSHSIKISNLKRKTTYYYVAISKDTSDISVISGEQSFTTTK